MCSWHQIARDFRKLGFWPAMLASLVIRQSLNVYYNYCVALMYYQQPLENGSRCNTTRNPILTVVLQFVALICWLKLVAFICCSAANPIGRSGWQIFWYEDYEEMKMSVIATSGFLKCTKQRAVQSSLWHGQFSVLHFADSCLRCLRIEHNHRSAAHSGRQLCLSQYICLLICIAIWQCEYGVEFTGTLRAENMRLYCGGIINNID